ncbi:MAG: CHAT domain-containing protein/predicted negative regulator of RcsB-dependent stress response [Saprospiraceae bacterium]|jgi:CHAT domain-containing protein/predicted negative regulator of RcsB-dependent stress response
MRKHFLQTLFFIVSFSVSTIAQEYHKLVKADSLAHANEFDAAINLINGVLNENPRNFLKAQAYYQLSYVYLQLYDLESARGFNEMSKEIRNLLRYEFIADNSLQSGVIELRQGNPETALDYFLEAKELPHSSIQFSGMLDSYIGTAYAQLGKQEQALKNYQSALEILAYELGENHPQVAEAHFKLGNFYASVGDNKAIAHFDQSIAIELKSASDPDVANPRLANAYNGRGLAIFKENSNTADAIANFKEALVASKGLRRLTAVSRLNIAQMLFVNGEFDQAGKEVDLALESLYSKEKEDPQLFVPLVLDKSLYINGLRVNTEILLEAYFKDKNTKNLLTAYQSTTLAIEVSEGQILDLDRDNGQLSILQNARDIYEQAVYIALALYDATADVKYQNDAFQFAEFSKAIELKNQEVDFYEMFEKNLPDSIKKEKQGIRNQLTFLETDLAVKYKASNFNKDALNIHSDYQILLRKIEKAAPGYFDLKYCLPKVTVAEVQKKLAADEVLLSYYMGKDLYYIFAIGQKEISTYFPIQNTSFPGSTKADLQELVAEVNTGLNAILEVNDTQFISVSHSLYRRLIEPIKGMLQKKEKLVIIPHKELHMLAFETLLKEKPKKKIKYNKLNYLIRDHAISYELSADFMVQKQNTSKVITKSITVWAPVFNRESRREYSENEALTILEIYTQKKLKGKTFLKSDATEDQFKSEAANYTHVHITSHYFVNDRIPKLSGLALVPSGGEDGILYAGEVMNMNFRNTSLVVLNSADNGTGDLIHGKGLLSLNRAFLFAGVDNTISTRWKISDGASTQMMVYFYKKVLDGASYTEALRYAKLKMIRKSKTARPKFWAGISLTGS